MSAHDASAAGSTAGDGDAARSSTASTPRIGAATRLECRICWYVYDPAAGDPVWQVAPGTSFSDLPAHWSCPNCAGEKSGFLVLDDA